MNDAKKTAMARPAPSFRLRTESLNTVRLRRVFDLFDSNGDGELTAAELCSALDRLGLGADPAELSPIIATYVAPGAAGLSFEAFRKLHIALGDALLGPEDGRGDNEDCESEQKKQEDEDMTEAFKVFDEDGDGFISAAELQAVLGKLGLPEGRSIDRVRDMIGSVDRNADGQVDYNEFKHMMQGITVQGS